MPLADPGYVADVANGAVIDPDWGNAIRNRVTHHFASAAARDAAILAPVEGMQAHLNDVHQTTEYDGVAWRLPWGMPWGNIAEAKVTANQAGIGTVEVDITGLTVTFTAVGHRKYRVMVSGGFTTVQTAGNIPNLYIADGSNNHIGGTQGYQSTIGADGVGANGAFFAPLQTPAAGAVTYKVRGATNTATFTLVATATVPWTITVDDVGPNGAPT